MSKCAALAVAMFAVLFLMTGQAMAQEATINIGDIAGKTNDLSSKVAETGRNLDQIIENGRTIVDEINKIGDIVDPKMNQYYVDLKIREINMALESYRVAKQRYEDTGWWRPFARSSRKAEMEKALDEYMSRVMKLSQAKYEFAYDVYKNTSGFMAWRLPARQQKYQTALTEYSNLQLDWAAYKLRKAKQEYEDTPVILFLSRMARKKALEEAQAEYDQTRAFVETLWMDAGLITIPGLLQPIVLPEGEVDKIQLDMTNEDM